MFKPLEESAISVHLTKQQLAKLSDSLTELGLDDRNVNTLEGAGVLTVGQLLACCPHTQAQCDDYCACWAAQRSNPGFKPSAWSPPCRLLDISGFGHKTVKNLIAGATQYIWPSETKAKR